jgi:multiple antibiotic resistance protein
MSDSLLNALTILLVVIDPVGVAMTFGALTVGMAPEQRRLTAVRGVLLAAAILYAFALTGNSFLRALGIGLPAFRIAGGILLFFLAMDMLLARKSGLSGATGQEQDEAGRRADLSVFPLAIPLIAGPGAITSTVLLMGQAWPRPWETAGLLAMIAVALALTLAILLTADRVMHWLGVTGSNVVSRVLGIVLAALAVQFVLDGLHGAGLIRGG